ncbi:hypothetical protein BDR03DRAFT_962641, partial [Suillus americanus]
MIYLMSVIYAFHYIYLRQFHPSISEDQRFYCTRPRSSNWPRRPYCLHSRHLNSTVPIVASTLQKAGVYTPACSSGVTTLDVVHAAHFTAGIALKYSAGQWCRENLLLGLFPLKKRSCWRPACLNSRRASRKARRLLRAR